MTTTASRLNSLDSMLERNQAFAAQQSAAGTLMPSLPRALPNVKRSEEHTSELQSL